MLKTKKLALLLVIASLGSPLTAQPGQIGSSAVGATKKYEGADCKAYLNSLSQKLNKHWYIPDGSNKVTITCNLESDGTAQDVVAVSTPSNSEAEAAANTAFVQAQPYGTLPSSAGEKALLTLEFISNADPHGDSSRHINANLSEPVSAK